MWLEQVIIRWLHYLSITETGTVETPTVENGTGNQSNENTGTGIVEIVEGDCRTIREKAKGGRYADLAHAIAFRHSPGLWPSRLYFFFV